MTSAGALVVLGVLSVGWIWCVLTSLLAGWRLLIRLLVLCLALRVVTMVPGLTLKSVNHG